MFIVAPFLVRRHFHGTAVLSLILLAIASSLCAPCLYAADLGGWTPPQQTSPITNYAPVHMMLLSGAGGTYHSRSLPAIRSS